MTHARHLTKGSNSQATLDLNPANFPWPTIQMLTCVNYGVDAKLPTVKHLLACAAEHVGSDCVLRLSWQRWADITGLHRVTIYKTVALCERLGLLERIGGGRGRGHTVRYRVLLMARYPEAKARKDAWSEAAKLSTKGSLGQPFPVGQKGSPRQRFKALKGSPGQPDPKRKEKEIEKIAHEPYLYPSAEETLRDREQVLGPKHSGGNTGAAARRPC